MTDDITQRVSERTMLKLLRAGDEAGLQWIVQRYTPYVSSIVWSIIVCLSKGKSSKRARKRRAEAAPEIDMDNVDGVTVEAEGAGMRTFWCSFGARNRKQEARRAQLHTFW